MSSIVELKHDEFWKKKFCRSLEVLDTNKDSKISRADFDMVVQRYRELAASDAHIERLKASHEKILVAWGLADATVALTFDQCQEVYTGFLQLQQNKNLNAELFEGMFVQVDMDGDGMISYDEWVTHYKAISIDVKHARASFDAMDTNKDGKISKDEFVNYHTEYFYTAEDKLKSSILYGPMD